MEIPTASQMAKRLNYLVTRLSELKIIDNNRIGGFSEALSDLKSQGNSQNWAYKIEKTKPLIFKSILNPKLNKEIYPRIYVDLGLNDEANNIKEFPFKRLIVTLEILYTENNRLISRYHIDLANIKNGKFQNAPIFHLQFGGGNNPGTNELDGFKLKEPRWFYPPMDLVLMSEAVIANFYPDQWGKLKKQQGWINLIIESQQLCYSKFFEQINLKLNKDSLISIFWATNWNHHLDPIRKK